MSYERPIVYVLDDDSRIRKASEQRDYDTDPQRTDYEEDGCAVSRGSRTDGWQAGNSLAAV
jgi:hypothetical protein